MNRKPGTVEEGERIHAALKAANKKNAPNEAIQELNAILYTYPFAWEIAGDLSRRAREAMVRGVFKTGTPAVTESLKRGFERIAEDLSQPTDTVLEKLLIDQIVTCWLDEQVTRSAYAVAVGETMSTASVQSWQHQLTLTQKRYLRAIESLAKVRRLMRFTVQVNIAQPGSQVVNVAGDMQTGIPDARSR